MTRNVQYCTAQPTRARRTTAGRCQDSATCPVDTTASSAVVAVSPIMLGLLPIPWIASAPRAHSSPFFPPPPAPASCCAHQDAARHECKHHIEDRLSSSTQRKGAACQLPWMSRNDAAMFGPMSVTDVCQAVSKRPSQAIQTCGRHEPRSQACLLHGRYACTPVTLLFALSEAQAGGGQGGSRVNSEGTGMADAVGGLILLALPVETLPAPFLHTRPPVSWHTAFFSSIGLRLACACACACACAVCVPGATHYSTAPAADPATDVQQQRQGRVSCSLAAGAPVSERLGSHTIVRPLHPRSSGKHPWGAGKSHLTRV